MRFVDSHLHLGEGGTSEALALASANDVLLLTCGIDRETSTRGIKIAASQQSVRAFVGVHPSEAHKAHNLDWVPPLLKNATGIGEIGLDPKYSSIEEGSVQMKVFAGQLQAAEVAGKPVQVHSRGAEKECLDAMEDMHLRSVLMHWFQSEENLGGVTRRGYFVSFGPSLLSSKKLQRLAARCDPSHALTETDFPVSFGGLEGTNGPSLIPSVVFKLGEIWGRTFEEARALISENCGRFLGAAEKG